MSFESLYDIVTSY